MDKDSNQQMPDSMARKNRKIALTCVSFVALMVGAAYAAVPLYDLFCRVTGYGGTTQVADSAPDKVLDRKVTIRFDANVSGGLPWNFDSERREVVVNVGEAAAMDYIAENRTGDVTWGTSTFNVTPFEAGAYFSKIDCFCFTEQQLKDGESVRMPVVFYVDPEFATDPHMQSVTTITLSYTFFPADPPEQPVAGVQEQEEATNDRL